MTPPNLESRFPIPDSLLARHSYILGLTGSVGSGKSFVSSLLYRCRATIICADTLAREAVSPGSPALGEIADAFGSAVLLPDGSLDRGKLASLVFPDPLKRHQLESIIHPRVHARQQQLLEESKDSPLVVLDVPLLFESGFSKECDAVLVVLVTEEERLRRLVRDRAMTPDQIFQRLASQLPQHEKAHRADFLVDNSSSRLYTCNQLSRILRRMFPSGLPHPLRNASLD